MIQIILLPVPPYLAEASLQNLALGLPKLSMFGLPMLHLHRFRDVSTCRQAPSTSIGTQISDLQLMSLPFGVHVGDCPSFHS